MSQPGEIVAVASDHAGHRYRALAKAELVAMGFEVLDLGPHQEGSVDYPDFGAAAATAISTGKAQKAVIVCGSGIGISIAANRNPEARAALCTSGLMARLARQHNDANILALGERLIGEAVAIDCIREFFSTPFEGGRHAARVAKLKDL